MAHWQGKEGLCARFAWCAALDAIWDHYPDLSVNADNIYSKKGQPCPAPTVCAEDYVNAPQAALLDRLGIVLPKRMRFAEHERPALAASA